MGAVASQVWPLLLFTGVLTGAALLWMIRSGDAVPAAMAWMLLAKPALLGLLVPFALHESAHVLVLRRIPTVTHIALERTGWRTSVVPAGTMTGRQTALVALAGPLVCVAVGAVLWLTSFDRALSWWYLAHLAFLLPVFGDGRALWFGSRQRLTHTPDAS
ncbi:hypothetical protein DY218_06255 [Streptomyces triticagri]|uniref:DUF3267 domain-containing protein n=1 Tax=Streptomyces triticagri TaxID=2293568 RepID=A0A372MBA0_9ACTN|nr:hypothetical protein [Streptomyces triticagri]RFU87557.1 hypothetical protein DY218_06255 [Streptomyces triticagri]